jgi:hypothetical protein
MYQILQSIIEKKDELTSHMKTMLTSDSSLGDKCE